MAITAPSAPIVASNAALDKGLVPGSRFVNVNLAGAAIRNANPSGVPISNCNIAGLRVDDVLVSDLLAAYRKTA